MANPIPASTLLPLQNLHTQPVNTKVRFLGCVRAYDPSTATLTLTHPPKMTLYVEVIILLPLSTLDVGSLRDGQWLNVIGYTREERREGVARVDALTVWSAGNVSPSKYSEVLEGRLSVEGEMDAHQRMLEM